ncbi:MAG: hypothetical protein R2741_00520 [Methanolobus sp.]
MNSNDKKTEDCTGISDIVPDIESKVPPEIVRIIHDSPKKIVLSVTGGGSEAIAELLRYGGGSDTILEAIIPYSQESLVDFIGHEPESFASSKTAKEMAMNSYRRALYLNSKKGKDGIHPESLAGIGITCKLAKSTPERHGRKHEVHFAFQSYNKTFTSSILLTGDKNRTEEERIVANFVLEKIAFSCNPEAWKLIETTEINGKIIENEDTAEKNCAELLLRTLDDINLKQNSTPQKIDLGINNKKSKIVFSGSFNPFHKNHIKMARIAAEIYKQPVIFEISLANVDKPPIDYISLKERINSLLKYKDEEYLAGIYLSNSPLFADKAVLFPDSVFLIGTDTLNRLFNEDYYRHGEDRESLLKHFRKYNTRFLVFLRKDSEIEKGLKVPDICTIVPLEKYSDDGTSSTKIRKQMRKEII